MDPQKTYRDLLDALDDGDTETARDLALALQRWLACGGFSPASLTPEAMTSAITAAFSPSSPTGNPDPAFTLICSECDAGGDIATEEEAIAAGWSQIRPAPDLPQANFLGLCPNCRRPTDNDIS
jgi:hypothetical protein